MVEFIRQRNILNCNRNKISQINLFGKATFEFILVLHKAGWNRLNTSDKIPLRSKIKMHFVDTAPVEPCYQSTRKNLVDKIPMLLYVCLPHKQLEEVKKHLEQRQKIRRTSLTNHMPRPSPQLMTSLN